MSDEEREAELFLELMNMTAEWGLGDVQSFGGLGHAKGVGYGDECLYMPKVHGGRILYRIRMAGAEKMYWTVPGLQREGMPIEVTELRA
jgi:hypothetical protein